MYGSRDYGECWYNQGGHSIPTVFPPATKGFGSVKGQDAYKGQ